jgi:hypothetical protein
MPSDVGEPVLQWQSEASCRVSERVEKGEQLVIGSKAAHPPGLRFNFIQGCLLHLQICIEIDLRHLDRLMSEPQGDHATFHPSLQQFHRCRVAQHMRSHMLFPNDVQVWLSCATCFARRYCTPSALRRTPLALGKTTALPSHWTPAQAMAVFEVLDDLRELIWRSYGGQIQQALRKDHTDITAPIPGNIDDGDVPSRSAKDWSADIGPSTLLTPYPSGSGPKPVLYPVLKRIEGFHGGVKRAVNLPGLIAQTCRPTPHVPQRQ